MNDRITLFSKYISASMLVGSVTWVLLLVIVSQKVQAASHSHYLVKAGPLLLDRITERHIGPGGFTLSISFELGLLWYTLIWLILGIGLALIHNHSKTR